MHFHSLWVQNFQVYIQDFWNLKLWEWITHQKSKGVPLGVREPVTALCKVSPLVDGCLRMETVGGCAGVQCVTPIGSVVPHSHSAFLRGDGLTVLESRVISEA